MSVLAPPRWEVIYAEAHAERFRYLAGSGAEFLRRPGVLAVRTGADSNVDNGIVLEREDARHRRARRLVPRAGVADLLGVRGPGRAARAPFAAWVCARRPPASPPAPCWATCRRPRLRTASRSARQPGRATSRTGWTSRPSRASTRSTTASRARAPLGRAARQAAGGLGTAFFRAAPFCSSTSRFAEEERRRGIGTALALVRLHEALRLGCGLPVFGTTPESAALYASSASPLSRTKAAAGSTSRRRDQRLFRRPGRRALRRLPRRVGEPRRDRRDGRLSRRPRPRQCGARVGIGTGRIALPLAQRGIRVHGIDLSTDMVAQLRAKPGGEPFPSRSAISPRHGSRGASLSPTSSSTRSTT